MSSRRGRTWGPPPGGADLPWSGKTPSWARRAAHRAGLVARDMGNPASDETHSRMLHVIMQEYENRHKHGAARPVAPVVEGDD